MNIYPFSMTETMLNIIDKANEGKNQQMVYAISQAELSYPDMVVEKIEYIFEPNSVEDPVGTKCGTHKWCIFMKPISKLK